jgi:hypothetical protein
MRLLIFAVIAAASSTAFAQAPPAVVLTTAHFAFYSDLSTNVHDALIAVATARRTNQPDPFSESELACMTGLPTAERDAWDRAVEDYVGARSTNRQRYYERMSLAGFVRPDSAAEASDREFLRQWNGLREAATPAYRQCRWPAQDALNRQWIDHVGSLLTTYEQALGDRLPRLFASTWRGLPFRVDVVNGAGFSGANSADNDDPPTLHILVSSTNPSNQGPAALETVFHEACHFLTLPDSALSVALRNAAARAAATLPPDVVHQVHFFITGEAVRRVLADRGVTYTPLLFTLKLFSDRFRDSVSRAWPPTADDARALDEAADNLVRGMNAQP